MELSEDKKSALISAPQGKSRLHHGRANVQQCAHGLQDTDSSGWSCTSSEETLGNDWRRHCQVKFDTESVLQMFVPSKTSKNGVERELCGRQESVQRLGVLLKLEQKVLLSYENR